MRVLAAGVQQALVAHVRRRLPVLHVDTVSSLDCLMSLQSQSYDLLILGADNLTRGLDVMRVVRDVMDPGALSIIFLLPPSDDPEKGLKAATRLKPQHILMQPFSPDDLVEKVADMLQVPVAPARMSPVSRRRTTGSLVLRPWHDQQAMLAPRLDILERAARALDAGDLSVPLARTSAYEVERLRRFLSETGHHQGIQELTRLAPLFLAGEAASRPALPVVESLRLALAEPPGPALPLPEPEPAEGPSRGLVLILDADADWVDVLAGYAEAREFEVLVAENVAEGIRLAGFQRPDVAIVDPANLGELDAFFGALHASTPPVATLVLAAHGGQESREAGARLGANLFLSKPRSAFEVIGQVEVLLGLAQPPPYRLLVVVSELERLATIGTILEENQMVCLPLGDTAQFWARLEETRPDMLVLHATSGLDLCRMVRLDPQWRWLPVMVLLDVATPSALPEVYRVGADDFATLPLVAEDFVQRLRNRLRRQTAVRVSEEVDALTGVAARGRAIEQFGQFLAGAEHHQVPACLAVLNLDLFGDLNVVLGHENGDEILRHFAQFLKSHLPPETMVARWRGDEFTLGFYGLCRGPVTDALKGVQEAMQAESLATIDGRPLRVTFSGGVAEYPHDGTTFLDLHRSATTLVAEAKARGRRVVLSSAWFEDPEFMSRPVDLVIVHPDEALASQLLTALAVRGRHGYWIGDSTSILSRLLDSAHHNPVLVVVWNLDMPDVDSWAVLRLMQQDATLSQVRLLVLASEPTEAATGDAMALGARAVLDANLLFTELLYHIRHALG